MARSPRQSWFDDLQDLNQILQVENARLKTLLHVLEEENQRFQKNLQAMKVQTREGSTNETVIRPFCDHGNSTSYGLEHDSANVFTLCQAYEDDIQAYKNQGGFLEASSTDSSHQE
jgi:hypothetical protein